MSRGAVWSATVSTLGLMAVALLVGCGTQTPGEPRSGGPSEASSAEASAQSSGPAYRAAREAFAAALQRGDSEAARRSAMVALDAAPAVREPYALLSRIFVERGDDTAALQLFTIRVGRDPEIGHAWFFKGFHESRLQRWDVAVSSLERAVELTPNQAEAHYYLALALHTAGEFDRALEESTAAHRLAPEVPRHAARLSRALRVVGRYDEAERVVAEAMLRSPDSAELNFAMAQLRIRQGRDDDAERLLKRAVKLDPGLGQAHTTLVGLLMRAGREAEARRTAAIAERLVDYRRYRAFLLERMGLIPDHPGVPLLMAELELAEHRPREALQWAVRSESLGGDALRLAAARASAHIALGQIPRAEAELKRIEAWDDPRADLARAAFHASQGRDGQATNWLDSALSRGPEEKQFLRRAADVFESMGRDDASNDLLSRATLAPFPSAPSTSLVLGAGGTVETTGGE